jgi:hypothetical protein
VLTCKTSQYVGHQRRLPEHGRFLWPPNFLRTNGPYRFVPGGAVRARPSHCRCAGTHAQAPGDWMACCLRAAAAWGAAVAARSQGRVCAVQVQVGWAAAVWQGTPGAPSEGWREAVG